MTGFVCFMVYCKYPLLYTVIQQRLQMQICRHLWLFLLMSSENSLMTGIELVIILDQRWGSSSGSWVGSKGLQQNLCQLGCACYNLLFRIPLPALRNLHGRSPRTKMNLSWSWTWSKASSHPYRTWNVSFVKGAHFTYKLESFRMPQNKNS